MYRSEIDGLRAVAVVSVILYHAGMEAFSGGFVGVDVFFVISGYLITSIILNDLDNGKFNLLYFFERRARRILPALFLVLLISIPIAEFLLLPQEMKDFSQSILAVSLFSSNILFWFNIGYFDTAVDINPLIHTWSLAVEEQYYLLFPAFLMLSWRLGKEWILAILIVTALLSFSIAQWDALRPPSTTFYLLLSRGWEILIGAFVAFYLSKKKQIDGNELLSFLGLFMILYAVLIFDKHTPFPSIYTLLPTMGGALIIIFTSKKTLVFNLLSNRILVGVGLISYSAYLWHQPLFAFTRLSNIELNSYVIFALIFLTFSLAYFSWKYVEKIFRSKEKISSIKMFHLSLGFTIFFIFISSSGQLGHVNAMRFSHFNGLINPRGSDSLQLINECFLTDSKISNFKYETCLSNYNKDNLNILLLGDSHAASLYPGIKKIISEERLNISLLSASYCFPLITQFPENKSLLGTKRCEKINMEIRNIIKSYHFDLILISSYMLEYAFYNKPMWSYSNFYNDYKKAISDLNKNTKIAVIGQFPVWPKWLPHVLSKEIIFSTGHIPKQSSNGIDKKIFTADAILKNDLLKLKVPYISVINKLCKKNKCDRYNKTPNGIEALSADYGHLSLTGSLYVADLIKKDIHQLLKHK